MTGWLHRHIFLLGHGREQIDVKGAVLPSQSSGYLCLSTDSWAGPMSPEWGSLGADPGVLVSPLEMGGRELMNVIIICAIY